MRRLITRRYATVAAAEIPGSYTRHVYVASSASTARTASYANTRRRFAPPASPSTILLRRTILAASPASTAAPTLTSTAPATTRYPLLTAALLAVTLTHSPSSALLSTPTAFDASINLSRLHFYAPPRSPRLP